MNAASTQCVAHYPCVSGECRCYAQQVTNKGVLTSDTKYHDAYVGHIFSYARVFLSAPFTLTNTISLPGVDIKNIASDGTHLLVLGNVYQNDPIGIYTTSGQLLQTYQTGLALGALAWTGSNVVALEAGANPDLVYRISLPTGPSSGPFGVGPFFYPSGLGFDGSDLLLLTMPKARPAS